MITLNLNDLQGGESIFEILTSRYSAYGFIIDVLDNMYFPLAARTSTLRSHLKDPEYYAEVMNAWEGEEMQIFTADDDKSALEYVRSYDVIRTVL